MAETVRRQVTLTSEEQGRLQRRARERGLSEETPIGEVVRQSLGDARDQSIDQDREQGRLEWEQVMALMRARAALPPSSTEPVQGRGWTREQIHDERIDRRAHPHEHSGF